MKKTYLPITTTTTLEPGDLIREPRGDMNFDYYRIVRCLNNQNYEVQPSTVENSETTGVVFYYPFEKMIIRNCEKLF